MCLRQIRGSTIGNQISPTLCSIPVISRELQWKRSYLLWLDNLHQNIFLERYVDNRFGVVQSQHINQPAFTEFTQEWFYGAPVQLEKVDDTHFLGATINVNARTITPIPTTEAWKIRPQSSAGSTKALLQSFTSRAHLICQCTHPKAYIPHHLKILQDTYTKAGFSLLQTTSIIHKVLKLHKLHKSQSQNKAQRTTADQK